MLHAAMLGLMSLSVLLAIIGSNGGVWSVNELENNRFFNGTIYFGLTEFYTEGNFDESVFPGPHDIDSYHDAQEDANSKDDADLNLDYDNLWHAGKGVTVFLVVGIIFNLAQVAMLLAIRFAGKIEVSRFLLPCFILGIICMFLSMLIWILLGHTASIHVPMDLFAPRIGLVKLSGPRAERSTGFSYDCTAAAFVFNLFASVPAYMLSQQSSAMETSDYASDAQPTSSGFQADSYSDI